MKKIVMTILATILFLSTASMGEENGYMVQDSYVLNKDQTSINSKIVLLKDKNLPAGIPNAELEADKYKPMILQIIDSQNKTIDSKKFEYPIAWIEKKIYDGTTFYFLTIDEYVGMGSYSGKRTLLFQVKNGKIMWQSYHDDKTKKDKDIVLYSPLKSAWEEASSNKNIGFNQIYCKPNFDKDEEFTLSYVRYVYEDNTWKKFENKEIGYWEADHDFPDHSKFNYKGTQLK